MNLILDFLANSRGAAPNASYWHLADLVRLLYLRTSFEPTQNLRLWFDQYGKLAGFGVLDDPASVTVQVRPDLAGLGMIEEQAIGWSEKRAHEFGNRNPEVGVWALDSDTQFLDLLARRGFEKSRVHVLWMRADLRSFVPHASWPDGWRVQPVGPESEWRERADAHSEIWHPSKDALPLYRRMRRAPGYDPELDLVAVDANGKVGAYCVCWYDPTSGLGQFEPVGTRAAYRHKGLARAVVAVGMRRLQARGAESVLVHSVWDNPASTSLYTGMRFEVYDRDCLYTRNLSN